MIAFFGSPRWLAYLLPWFMLLLMIGTVAQRYIGIVEAQRLFFSSWIFWLGPIPTLGGIATLALISLNLTVKLLFLSAWEKCHAGTIIAHAAVLMLLLGGGITFLVSQEGYVSLLEGEQTSQMQDYYQRELSVTQNGKPVAAWNEEALKEGATLSHPNLPFSFKIDEFCSNCGTFVQEKPKGKVGIARKLLLQDAPPAKEKEENKAGIAFTVKNKGYIAYELLPSQSPVIDGYRFEVARRAIPLPFTVRLLDFEKIHYPGSDQAKEYQSLVEIKTKDKTWQQTIAMNEPLRYDGYALYQSSFLRVGEQEASVLSVVKNDGWLLPYISTFLLAVGLIWQSLLEKKKREQRA